MPYDMICYQVSNFNNPWMHTSTYCRS